MTLSSSTASTRPISRSLYGCTSSSYDTGSMPCRVSRLRAGSRTRSCRRAWRPAGRAGRRACGTARGPRRARSALRGTRSTGRDAASSARGRRVLDAAHRRCRSRRASTDWSIAANATWTNSGRRPRPRGDQLGDLDVEAAQHRRDRRDRPRRTARRPRRRRPSASTSGSCAVAFAPASHSSVRISGSRRRTSAGVYRSSPWRAWRRRPRSAVGRRQAAVAQRPDTMLVMRW